MRFTSFPTNTTQKIWPECHKANFIKWTNNFTQILSHLALHKNISNKFFSFFFGSLFGSQFSGCLKLRKKEHNPKSLGQSPIWRKKTRRNQWSNYIKQSIDIRLVWLSNVRLVQNRGYYWVFQEYNPSLSLRVGSLYSQSI